jgi:Domain of unknown function (DUF5668)/N-terminal domain of toast_rack, DUF2154
MSPARLRWGVILIIIGGLMLLKNLDYVSNSIWEDILVWSPVLLILIGIEKIFTKSSLQAISYGTSFVLLFGVAYLAMQNHTGIDSGSFFERTHYELGMNDSLKRLHAKLDLGSTNLTIRDNGSELVYGRFERFTAKPDIGYEEQNNEGFVSFESRSKRWLGGVVKVEVDESQDWYLRFSDMIPLDLECVGSNSEIHLNLAPFRLDNLKLRADNASVYVKLGDLESLAKVSIAGQESRVKLRLPGSSGVRIVGSEYDQYLQTVGMISRDGGFVNAGYDSSGKKIEVDLGPGLSSFSLDFF